MLLPAFASSSHTRASALGRFARKTASWVAVSTGSLWVCVHAGLKLMPGAASDTGGIGCAMLSEANISEFCFKPLHKETFRDSSFRPE
jgi:hypothetical protein